MNWLQSIVRGKWSARHLLLALATTTLLALTATTAIFRSGAVTENPYTRERLSDPAYTDATLAPVQIGAINFIIPRQYLYSHVESKQPQTSILLLALGPKLEPRTRNTINIGWLNHTQRVEKFGYDPFITIFVRDATRSFPFEKIVEGRTTEKNTSRLETTEDGLTKYEIGFRSTLYFREVTVEVKHERPTTFIECRPNGPAPRCEMIFRHQSLQIHAHYPMNDGRIENWHAFRATVVEKLDSFIDER